MNNNQIKEIIETELSKYYHDLAIMEKNKPATKQALFYFRMAGVQSNYVDRIETRLIELGDNLKTKNHPILNTGKITLWTQFVEAQNTQITKLSTNIDPNNWRPHYQKLIKNITDKFNDLKNSNQ